ncbi:MAG TPA: HypC/HybG/HupF family hydrogenase formation chaperone [Conexibacter sp.]|nr:HypC/HybG/HupF family hydrogenase formation chaperone [Conexibacter sp.]
MHVTAREPEPAPVAAPGIGTRRRATRGNDGMAMRVLLLDPAGGSLARCAGTDGIPATVETVLVTPLEAGAVVLVHAGVALLRLDAEWVP